MSKKLEELLSQWPTYDQLARLAPASLGRGWSVEPDDDEIVLTYLYFYALRFYPDGRVQIGRAAMNVSCFRKLNKLLKRRDGFNWDLGDWYVDGVPVDDCLPLVQLLQQRLRCVLSLLAPSGSVTLNLVARSGQLARVLLLNSSLSQLESGVLEQVVQQLADPVGWPQNRHGRLIVKWQAASETELALLRQQVAELLDSRPNLQDILQEIIGPL
ncbi:MAG: hypothetical protein NZ482_03730 [Gloeomargarita sp. SKYG98]|nr:hypothetical protein [Gloeomargarita sp. SKYG98]